MIRILAAAALVAVIATPVSAQSVKSKKQKMTGTWMTQEQKARATGYSPSGNPQWDVYVRGEYVGSDPDPRVRDTLRREATRNYGFR
jgi:hypothetical protein